MNASDWAFAKYHGLGNDFLVGFDRPDLTPRRVRELCHRSRGIGADGVMLLGPKERRGWPVRIVNADGTAASFSGNGVRCAAAYLFDTGEARRAVTLRPAAGPVRVEAGAKGHITLSFEIRLFQKPDDPPMRLVPLPAGFPRHFTRPIHVVLGNPHAVFFVADADRLPAGVERACDQLRHPGETFRDGVNVSLISHLAGRRYRMRTWERGVGLSPSCASAACAALHAGCASGKLPASVRFVQDGGEVKVSTDFESISLGGPIVRVFEGRV